MAPASAVFVVVGLIIFLASGCTCPRMTEASVYVSLLSIVSIFFLQKNSVNKIETAVRNCTDVPSPQMLEQGILVCRGYDAFARLCSKSTTWSQKWYCDKSCQQAGFGYPDSACIPRELGQETEAPKGFVHNFRAWADAWVEKYRWVQHTVRDLNLSSSRLFVTFALATLILSGVSVFRSTVGLEALFYCILFTIAVIAYSSSRGSNAAIAEDARFHSASTPKMGRDNRQSFFFDMRECTDCFKDVAMPAETLDWTLARQDTEVLKVLGESDVGMTLNDEEYTHRTLQFKDLKRFCDNKGRGNEVHFLPVALHIVCISSSLVLLLKSFAVPNQCVINLQCVQYPPPLQMADVSSRASQNQHVEAF